MIMMVFLTPQNQGIYNLKRDADGDGLPNYLDIVNNAGQSSDFSPDGSSTSYTDANNNGILMFMIQMETDYLII